MRAATAIFTLALLGACNDLRDYRGDWQGHRVGDASAVRVGVPVLGSATLTIDAIDEHGMHGTVAIDQVVVAAPFASIEGAEADQLAGLTFTGGPIRVYLAFVPTIDSSGDALAMVALYDDGRLQLRVMRGGPHPLYGIFEMTSS